MAGGGTSLPPKLRRLVALDRLAVSEPAALALAPREVAALKEVVSRRAARPEGIGVGRAISALALRDRSAETAELLAAFVADEQEAQVDRAVAAAGLRLNPTAEARAGLVANLGVADPVVRLEVIASLGSVGDEDALAALNRLRREGTAAEQRQLAFSKALIAHRAGLTGEYLPFRQGVTRKAGPDDALIPLSLRPMRPRTIAAEREQLRGSGYGIPLSESIGFRLQAGAARWTVFVNGELAEGGILARSSKVFERPWLTALLARFDERTGSTAVQYVVLTDPSSSGARLMVVRTDGELVYSGSLTRPAGVLSFAVRDVARRGTAPTNVKGRLTGRGVELELTLPFGRRRNPSTGEDVIASTG